MFNDRWEELRTEGYDFPEGHGTLVDILDSMPDMAQGSVTHRSTLLVRAITSVAIIG